MNIKMMSPISRIAVTTFACAASCAASFAQTLNLGHFDPKGKPPSATTVASQAAAVSDKVRAGFTAMQHAESEI